MNRISQASRLIIYFVVSASGILVGLAPLIGYPDFTWHDQQRVVQILLACLAFFGLIRLLRDKRNKFSLTWVLIGSAIIFLGGVSAFLSQVPSKAFAEVSLLIASIGVAGFMFAFYRAYPEATDFGLGVFIRVLLGGVILQFYVGYLSALAHPDMYFTQLNLIHGFSNERHQGQFLTLTVPLLVFSIVFSGRCIEKCSRWVDDFMMISLACLVFVAGTRGTVMGWAVAIILFAIIGGGARLLAKRFLIVMSLGFVLSWVMVTYVEEVTHQSAHFRFSGGQVFGLSAREMLWADAWNNLLRHPWLGIGPMHFAALKNPVAAHPHQAVLQIASEWGIPVLILMLVAICVWLKRAFVLAQGEDGASGSELRWAILFALSASILQSMVDGVLVMPYVQIWLAILVGWGSAKFLALPVGAVITIPYWVPLVIFFCANAVLVGTLYVDYSQLVGAAELCSGGPRFWCHGRIE